MLVEGLQDAARSGWMPPALASKQRGKSTWISSHLMGRLGRVGQSALKQQQYGGQCWMDEDTARQLLHHACILQEAPPRELQVVKKSRPPCILYTDAEYTPGAGTMPLMHS